MLVALLAEGVDRNFKIFCSNRWSCASPSSRRAWIEIQAACRVRRRARVALLAEGVDRNITFTYDDENVPVALLAEGVDRNKKLIREEI